MTLLREICSRLDLSGQLNEVTVQSIRALRSHGIDLKDIEKAIRDVTGISQKKLDELLDDVVERNQTYYRELITLAKVTEPETLVDQTDIDAIKAQCQREFGNITRSMGFLVNNGKTMLPPAKAYQHCLDAAELKIQSGAISYNEAIRGAVRELADSGLKTAEFAGNRHEQIDVCVRRSVMTAVNQINQRYREHSMEFLQSDLVETTAHIGARNTGIGYQNHEQWQGHVFRWSKYPKTSKGEYPDFEESCAPGDVQGIGGANCRHSFFCYVEGVSERTHTDAELEEMKSKNRPKVVFDGKEYDTYQSTQAQRRIEASIRRWKRRKVAAEANGDTDDATAAGARLRALNKKYTEFSKAAGLPRQIERMRVEYV